MATSTTFDGEWQTIRERVGASLRAVLPFQCVDVTTEDPTVRDPGALMNSGGTDTTWGIRVLIGGSRNDWFMRPTVEAT